MYTIEDVDHTCCSSCQDNHTRFPSPLYSHLREGSAYKSPGNLFSKKSKIKTSDYYWKFVCTAADVGTDFFFYDIVLL